MCRNPYQVLLRYEKAEIFAPIDDDDVIRRFDKDLCDLLMNELVWLEDKEKEKLEKKRAEKREKKKRLKQRSCSSTSSTSSTSNNIEHVAERTEKHEEEKEGEEQEERQEQQQVQDEEDDDLICPISLMKLEDPVVCSDGHIYEKTHIELWIGAFKDKEPTSPLTGEIIKKDVYSVHLINKMVREQQSK